MEGRFRGTLEKRGKCTHETPPSGVFLYNMNPEQKLRLLPKKTLAVLGLVATIGFASLGIERHGHEQITPYYASQDYGVFAEDGGFEGIFRNNDSYRFAGKFHGVKEEKNFTAVGNIANEQCLVTILHNGPVTTFTDDYLSPYFVQTVDDKK